MNLRVEFSGLEGDRFSRTDFLGRPLVGMATPLRFGGGGEAVGIYLERNCSELGCSGLVRSWGRSVGS